jgi:hypothetical protein
MSRSRVVASVILFGCFCAHVSVLAQDYLQETQPIAIQALANLKSLPHITSAPGGDQNLLQNLSSPTLGEGFGVRTVNLSDLRSYKSDVDPSTLLKSKAKVIYPVLSSGLLASSMTFERGGEQWKPPIIGRRNFITLLSRARDATSKTLKLPSSNCFTLEIPEVNMYFIGCRAEKQLMLTPIIKDSELGFDADHTVPARDVFIKLVPIATHYNHKPM